MILRYRHGEQVKSIDVSRPPVRGGSVEIVVDGEKIAVEIVRIERDEVIFRYGGETVRAHCAIAGDKRHVACAGEFAVTLIRDDGSRRSKGRSGHEGGLEATMHSQVVSVAATVGAAVKRGDVLVTLEAMKMEMRIAAPFDGTVRAVSCAVGEVVERGRVLVEIEPNPS